MRPSSVRTRPQVLGLVVPLLLATATLAAVVGAVPGERSGDAAGADVLTDPKLVVETVATLPAYAAVGLTWLPDGRMVVWQEDGLVRLLDGGVVDPTPFLDLRGRVNTVNDRGLLGIALDPSFAVNGRVYAHYAYEPTANPNDPAARTLRVSRFTAMVGDPDQIDPGSEVVLVGSSSATPCASQPAGTDCIGADSDSHNGGTLRFAPDGNLFVSVGDGASYQFADPLALRAQNIDRYEGKILRIRPDGTAPGDNPFDDGTNSIRSKVWAFGLRNPYRFALHPTTGEPYIGDVGWNSWDEINRGRGRNFGWPCYEGNAVNTPYRNAFQQCRDLLSSSVTPPLHTYSTSGGAAVVGGTFLTSTSFPASWRGSFLYADYVKGHIKRMTFNPDGSVASVVDLATGVNGPVAIEQGPDGGIYYLSLPTGQVRRIRWSGAPVMSLTASAVAGPSPLAVDLSAAGSLDPEGGALSFAWDLGDGALATGPTVSHTFTSTSPVRRTVRVTATDPEGLSSSATVDIVVGARPPTAEITAPAASSVVPIGSTVDLTSTATDPDGPLAPGASDWRVLVHHDEHVHPFRQFSGPSGSFVVEDHGAGRWWYEAVLTVTDPEGLSVERRVGVYPAGYASYPPAEVFVSDLDLTAVTNGWGVLERDRSNGEAADGDGRSITIGGVTHAKGLGVHALSNVSVAVPVGVTRLLASVGVDDEVGTNGSVVFRVFVDGVQRYDSGIRRGPDPAVDVDVDVAGAAAVRLEVTNAGDNNNSDHASWGSARFVRPGVVGNVLSAAGPGQAELTSVTRTVDGDRVVAGWFSGTVTLGEGASAVTRTADGIDAMVARVSPAGTLRWVSVGGGPGGATLADVSVGVNGHVVVAGRFTGGLDWGALTAVGAADGVVAMLDPATGSPQWARAVSTPGDDGLAGIGVDRWGQAVAVGTVMSTPVRVGSKTLAITGGGGGDGVVAGFDVLGGPRFVDAVAGPGDDAVRAVDVTPDNLWVYGGHVTGSVTVTRRAGAPLIAGKGATDAFVARAKSGGLPLWGRRLGGTGADSVAALASDSTGRLLVGMTFSGVAVTGVAGPSLTSVGATDVALVRLGIGGTTQLAQRLGGPAADEVHAVDAVGADVVLVGSTPGVVSAGAFTVAPVGGIDGYAARFATATSSWSWLQPVGAGVGTDRARDLTGDASGVTVVGSANEVTAFGVGTGRPTLPAPPGGLGGFSVLLQP